MIEIKCPYCGYDGSDLKIGRRSIGLDVVGNASILCSKCKRNFQVKFRGDLAGNR